MHVNDGVAYHRHIAPIKALEKYNWSFAYPEFNFGKSGMNFNEIKDVDPILRKSDILITQRNDLPQYISGCQVIQAGYKIPWVYDTDDDVHAVRPSNPGFSMYNMHSETLQWSLMALERAFAVTVSTQTLKDIYKKNNKHVYVLPNGIDMARWDKFKIGKKKKGEIRIGLIVSGGHYENILMIEDVLREVLRSYPNVVLYTFSGFKPAFLTKSRNKINKQIKWFDWAEGDAYPKMIKDFNLDIGLAPLVDNDFNRSKSNLRWLEYSTQGIPTVASFVEPYKCAQDGSTILFAKNDLEWFNCITRLIQDVDLCKRIGSNARKLVEKKYDINVVSKIYDSAYRDIIKKFVSKYGIPHREPTYNGINKKHIEDSIQSISDSILRDNVGTKYSKTR